MDCAVHENGAVALLEAAYAELQANLMMRQRATINNNDQHKASDNCTDQPAINNQHEACPSHMRGRFRNAMRMAMEEVERAMSTSDEVAASRAWKVFLLIPRMLLHKKTEAMEKAREKTGCI